MEQCPGLEYSDNLELDTLSPAHGCKGYTEKVPHHDTAQIVGSGTQGETTAKLFAFQQPTTDALISTSSAYASAFGNSDHFSITPSRGGQYRQTQSRLGTAVNAIAELSSHLLQEVRGSRSRALLQHNLAFKWHCT